MSDVNVEVVYALPEKQFLKSLRVPQGTTVEEVIRMSGLLETRQDINLAVNKVGIFSRAVKLSDEVKEGDRIEIYRPLIADPKELRRMRAERSKNRAS